MTFAEESSNKTMQVSFETVTLVTESWDTVKTIPNVTMVAGELLFRKIFEIAPGAWKLFPFGQNYDALEDDMFSSREFRSHAKQVIGMVDTAVNFLGPDLSILEESLIDLGARHVAYGVLPEHYPIVGQALLSTLEIALGGKDVFTKELKDAWTGVYGFITSNMLQGANESLLRLSFPLYSNDEKKEERTLDAYITGMIQGQRDLYYRTESIKVGSSSSSSSIDTTTTIVKTLQEAGVEILCIKKNKEAMIIGGLEKYVGRKLVNVMEIKNIEQELSFLSAPPPPSSSKTKSSYSPTTNNMSSLHRISEHTTTASEDESWSSTSTMNHDTTTTTTTTTTIDFCDWFQRQLGTEKVVKCTATCPIKSVPARVICHENVNEEIQNKMSLEDFDCIPLPKKHVEINMDHPIIISLEKLRMEQTLSLSSSSPSSSANNNNNNYNNSNTATMIAQQLYDNCLINAGLLDDGRTMVHRINDLMMLVMNSCTMK